MIRPALLACSSLVAATLPAAALDVVASMKPVHSLVAGVMEGAGEPSLIVDGAGSPHAYTMRPSQARALEDAALVFWIGPGYETFLTRPLDTLAGDARIVELGETPGLVRLDLREGGAFDAHDHGHGDHGHDHSHDHHGHDHDGHDHADEGGHDHAGHHHDETDMHLWLDPENAKLFVDGIQAALSDADPENGEIYARNAEALRARLDDLVTETQARMDGLSGRGFIAFHDAYHYFEHRFGIEAAGTITVNPETAPGAQRINEIKARIDELDAACVFSEPQFEPRIVTVVTEGTDARTGVLDPLGAEIANGPDLYFELIRNLATSFETCLSPA